MQSYLVIPGFIRPLLVMVVEDGGQNRVHLGETLVFEGSWGGRQGCGEGESAREAHFHTNTYICTYMHK